MSRAEPSAQPAEPFPALLSKTGLFTDCATLVPAHGVTAYEINAPSWHDGATSTYHIALPKAGAIEARGTKSWQAPDGTVLAQTLAHEGRRLETRILVKQQNDWAGYTFQWDDSQKDAKLASKEGADFELANKQSWRVPSRAECMMCHSRQANFALTLHDAQLNRGDQLQRWERMGMIASNAVSFGKERAQARRAGKVKKEEAGQRSAPIASLLPSNPENLAKFVPPGDASAPIADRARSYLGANCAHCHTMYGGGNSAMEFDWLFPDREMQAINQPPQHGTMDLADARVIAPSAPGRSVIIPRVARRGPGQMPPVGTRIADPDGARVLAEWIESLRPE